MKEDKNNLKDRDNSKNQDAKPVEETSEQNGECDKQEEIDFDNLSREDAIQMLKHFYVESVGLAKELDALKEQFNKAVGDAQANKDSWYRCAAEFENFKKRNSELRQTAYFDGKKDAITSLVVIGDSVDRALSVELDDKTREGVMLIKRQFSETLTALGVEEIDPLGKVFDPSVAEAIAMVACAEGEESGFVKTVFKKGYKLNGKMLRYAQVIVTQ